MGIEAEHPGFPLPQAVRAETRGLRSDDPKLVFSWPTVFTMAEMVSG